MNLFLLRIIWGLHGLTILLELVRFKSGTQLVVASRNFEIQVDKVLRHVFTQNRISSFGSFCLLDFVYKCHELDQRKF